MSNGITIERSILIDATTAVVWDALTNAAKVKQYMFGTDMVADWRVGGRVTYSGVWEGKAYTDGGTILALEPEHLMSATYWSSMSGTEDKPENYATVTYILTEQAGATLLEVRQDNNASAESAEHSGSNWQMVLESIKKLCEG